MTHLGSIAAISNELDEMGVIHMNGRIFDPLIGRFMSADPFIQAPGNLQSYNRYAYVLNNPLAFTDPSGYFSLGKLFKASVRFSAFPSAKNTFNFIAAQPGQRQIDNFIMTHRWASVAGQAVVGFFTGPFCGGCGVALWSSYYAYQGTGSMSAAYRAGAVSYLTAELFAAAGRVGAADSPARYLAHAGAGCISAVAGGGKCGQGAVGAVFGKFTTNTISGVGGGGIGGVIARGVATSVAGGVGSVIAGGKFANGAETAAYGYLFNQLLSAAEAERRANARNAQVMQGRGCVAEAARSCAGFNDKPANPEELGQFMSDMGTGVTAAGLVIANPGVAAAGEVAPLV